MSREQAALPRPETPAATGITDADLVGRARAGDSRAFDALYRRHATLIGGISARLLGTRQGVDDIVHDTFVAASEQLDRLRDAAAFRGWLTQIAVLKSRQTLRRHRLRARFGLAYTTPDATLEALASPSLSPEQHAELAMFDRALADLDVDARIAWMLRHVEGYSVAEVAEHCGCSESTVKRRIETAARMIERVASSSGWRSS